MYKSKDIAKLNRYATIFVKKYFANLIIINKGVT